MFRSDATAATRRAPHATACALSARFPAGRTAQQAAPQALPSSCRPSIAARKHAERWQLYHLAADPGEVHDLAKTEPDRLRELVKLWDQYVLETGVIPLSPELGRWMAAMEEQMPENAWIEYEYWKDGARADPAAFTKTVPRFQRRVVPI